MSINELKTMSEKERTSWIVNASNKELGLVLKNYGIKNTSKMNKAEKLSMVLDLAVENIPDEEIDAIWEDAKRLNKDLNYRNSYKESIDATLYAMYKSKK